MDFWTNVVVMLHVIVALAIIGLVLLQHGKGADMGSGFGGGTSGSLFGATGSANFLSRTTAVLATLFFVTSLGLGFLATHKPAKSGGSVVDVPAKVEAKKAPEGKAPEAPAAAVPSEPAKDASKEPAKAKDVPN